jgi:uncharacterized protein YqjF (DUF2071 family)
MDSERVVLTAEWRRLAMLNYEVDPELLLQFVPRGTELDDFNGRVLVSLVGFQFLKTRVLGLPIPFHTNFDEVNLRFYVRRRVGQEVRRGVVFIREIVPRRAIAFVARVLYNENYVALPMTHRIDANGQGATAVSYSWQTSRGWSRITLEAEGNSQPLNTGSEQQFISEHYWGYAMQRGGGTVEYQVAHPSWRVWIARRSEFTGEVEEVFGRELAAVLRGTPASAFLAEGSAVAVMRGRRL